MPEQNVTTKFKVDISDLKKGIADANKSIKLANAEFKNATAGMDNWAKSADGLSAKIKQQNAVIEAEKTKLDLLKQQLDRLNQSQENGEKIIAELTAQYNEAVKTYGATSEQAKKYAKQLSDAQAAQERNAKAVDDLNIKIINQDTAVKNAESQLGQYETALAELKNESEKAAEKTETLTEKVGRQQTELDELKQKYKDVAAEQGTSSTEANELAAQISELSGELKDNKSKLNDAEQAADEFDKSLEDVDDTADNTTNGGLQVFAVALGNLAANVISSVIGKMKEMITQTVEVGKTFDTSMSQVAAVSGATGDELAQLRDKAKEMGSTTKFTASEAADAFNYMAMAGWKTEDMLNGIDGILNLAAASGSDLATTSDIVTDALTAMGYGAGDAGRLADVMAAASSNANTNVEMMGETFKYAAPVVGALGYSMEDTAVAVGLMANSGIKASQAGTALRGSLSRLTNPTKAMTAQMEELGLITTEAITAVDSEKLKKAQQSVAEKTAAMEKAQIKYNAVLEDYGESSAEAQTAMINLETAQLKLANAEQTLQNEQSGTIEGRKIVSSLLTDESGNMRSLQDVMEILRDKMGDLDESQQAQAASIIFGQEAMSGMLAIVNASEEDFNKLTSAVANSSFSIDAVNESLKNSGIQWSNYSDKAWTANGGIEGLAEEIIYNVDKIGTSTDDLREYLESEYDMNADDATKAIEAVTEAMENSEGAAQRMADTMLDNLGGDMTLLQSKLEGVQLAIYEKFEPALRKGVGVLDKLLDAVQFVVDHGTEFIIVLGGMAAAVAAYLAYTTAIQVMTKGWRSLWAVQKLVAAGQAALNAVMALNPIGLIVAAIAGLVAAFVILWNKSEKFRNFWISLWDKIKNVAGAAWTTIKKVFAGAWDTIKTIWGNASDWFSEKWDAIKNTASEALDAITGFFVGAWETIKSVFSTIATWINENVFQPIKAFFQPVIDFFRTAFEIIFQLAEGCWKLIKAVWGVVSTWFNIHVIQPVKKFFNDLWTAIKTAASVTWEAIKATWNVVSSWFNIHIITPVKNFFTAMWDAIETAASAAWEGIKNVWNVVSGWFNNTIIEPVKSFFGGMWDKVKSGASDAWEGIKNVFGSIADWFEEKFSTAWQKVKDVFSTGGQVFEGIKDGITDAFKNVVNAIIRGINKVIALPFNAINDALDTIRNIEIAGVQPFEGLISRFDVPEIPELEQGGILKRGQVGLLEGNGAEAVVPLEKNTVGLRKIAGIITKFMELPELKPIADAITKGFEKINSLISEILNFVQDIEVSGVKPFENISKIPELNTAAIRDAVQSIGQEVKQTAAQRATEAPANTVNNYNFNQTNNSPKALSRFEIYRQTKNLINATKGV